MLDILRHLDYSKYEVDLLLTEQLGDYADKLPPQVNVLLSSIEGTYGPPVKVVMTSICNRDWFGLKMWLIFLVAKMFGQKWITLAKNILTGKKHYDCVVGFLSGFCTQIAVFACNADNRITWWHHGSVNVDVNTYLTEVENCCRVVAVSEGCRKMLANAMPAWRC